VFKHRESAYRQGKRFQGGVICVPATFILRARSFPEVVHMPSQEIAADCAFAEIVLWIATIELQTTGLATQITPP